MQTHQKNEIDQLLGVILKICLALAVVAVLITLVFFSWWGMKDRLVFGHQKFNQITWMTALENNAPANCTRGDMAYDLQQNILQAGLTLDKITLILGRPSWEENTANSTQVEYDLGKCMQVEHGLRLYFDPHLRLTHSRITQH